jgi:2,3-bisphosphoglycerate-dependent phosphoglycerate mutase
MLTLICHPETELQEQKLWQGTLDSQLSANGLQIAHELEPIAAERAYVAPSSHVLQFAKIILKNEFTVIPQFADRSMGNLTGREYRQTLNEFPRRNWLAWHRSYWTAPPDGESLFDISDRVLTTFRTQVAPVLATEKVAIVCAADVLRMLIGYITKQDETELMKIEIQSAIPYVVNGEIKFP